MISRSKIKVWLRVLFGHMQLHENHLKVAKIVRGLITFGNLKWYGCNPFSNNTLNHTTVGKQY